MSNLDLSKEGLVKAYLEAEAKRAKSKSIFLLIGGLVFGVIAALACEKIGINENWGIIPGALAAAIGFMMALVEKSECDQTCNRMRDCANLTSKEFHQLRNDLNEGLKLLRVI